MSLRSVTAKGAFAAVAGVQRERVVALAITVAFHALLIGVLARSTTAIDPVVDSGSDTLQVTVVSATHAHSPREMPVKAIPEPAETTPVASTLDNTSRATFGEDQGAPPASPPKPQQDQIDGSASALQYAIAAQPLHDDVGTLLQRYRGALASAAIANWDKSRAPAGVHCTIDFTQVPGGEVILVRYADCPFDVVGRESIERAMHTGAMPYTGYESVFGRQQTLDFCYPEDACGRSAVEQQDVMVGAAPSPKL